MTERVAAMGFLEEVVGGTWCGDLIILQIVCVGAVTGTRIPQNRRGLGGGGKLARKPHTN